MNESHYQPHNILVTGGCGFIGSHICIHLVNKYPNYQIVNLDKLDYVASLKNLKCLENAPNYKFIKGDILSLDLLSYVLTELKIDTIMHFAVQNHVDDSFGNSLEFTTQNVLGTHILLEAAKAHNIKRFIHVSTDEVYGEQAHQHENGVMEESVLEPPNPYAASKAAAEHLVKTYYKSFKLPIIITRSNNVYGPHQHPEKMIPKFISLLQRNRPCTIHGGGKSKKRYLYVDDVIRAFDIILHSGAIGEIYNIGTNFEVSPLEVAKKLIQMFNLDYNENYYLEFYKDREFSECRYALDASKLYSLGWKPQVEFEEGLKKTIVWYKDHFGSWDNAESALVPHPKLMITSLSDTNESVAASQS